MANPAPIISSIGAFDITEGTTIYYNVIGATEIIRSSRIQIYGVSDNVLKMTYLYTGTMQSDGQYQLVLPASAISGLSNGTQYYARIETYTSTDGVTGASGYSVAKLFYCLAAPTLTAPTISAQVSTTTYNAIFTYTYSGNVVNKIQQYEIELLEGTNVVETSGVVVGEGTQTASTTYQVSYNFSSLTTDTTYTIKCTVVTTQGSVVEEPSNQFTCTIQAPSVSRAIVTNNACGGYITVASQITNIEGVFYSDTSTEPTYVSTNNGVVLTTDGDYVEWATGLTAQSSDWTVHMWAKNLQIADSFSQDYALIYLNSIGSDGLSDGKIGVFITENAAHTQIRAEMLIDIEGDGGNIATYQTSFINKPTDATSPAYTDGDTMYIQIRCIDNWYSITLQNLTT